MNTCSTSLESVPVYVLQVNSCKTLLKDASQFVQQGLLSQHLDIVWLVAMEILKLTAMINFATIDARIQHWISMLIIPQTFVSRLAHYLNYTLTILYQEIVWDGVQKDISLRLTLELAV